MARKLDFPSVLAFAAAQPGAEQTTHYGTPAIKVNGVAILGTGHERDTSFALHVGRELKDMLIETGPETFWETPHYAGSAWLLVRFDSPDPDRVREHIVRAAERARQGKPKKRKG